MRILITGGAGYIGSHTVLASLEAGHEVVVIDSLVNSSSEALKRVEQLTGKKIRFYQGGIEDRSLLQKIFTENKIDAVIHFAALKAVGESCEKPLLYYQNNVGGTLILLAAMQNAGVQQIIFSSSATVYGNPQSVPITEEAAIHAMSPYGTTKIIIESMLEDLTAFQPPFKAVLLRYFNPVGAHASGLIGEDPRGVPNNLTPYLTQVAIGRREKLAIFGKDYDTPDGTCIRDYIHVMDLARGHLAALNNIAKLPPLSIFNLGTGQGSSVLELVKTFENVTGIRIPYEFSKRRPGDIAKMYADVAKAKKELNWVAEYDLKTMLKDAWNWQQQNPNGFGGQT